MTTPRTHRTKEPDRPDPALAIPAPWHCPRCDYRQLEHISCGYDSTMGLVCEGCGDYSELGSLEGDELRGILLAMKKVGCIIQV